MSAKISITPNEAYAIGSAISELESLMDGTTEEEYREGNQRIINALKRVLRKYKTTKIKASTNEPQDT